MDTAYTLLTGLALTVAASFAVVLRLKSHLKGILIDLCGTEPRANFWVEFSSVILVLTPAVFAMQFHSAGAPNHPALTQLIYQLKWSLVGLIASALVLGAILSLFIGQSSVRSR